MKEIKNFINNKTFLVDEKEKVEHVTPYINIYKAKIYYDGSLDKLKLRIVVRVYLQNKHLIGNTWSHTDSMKTLKYFLEYAVNHKARMHQLFFIGAFLHVKVKNRVFLKLCSRYADYFPEYSSYFGRALSLLKYMYGVNNSVKLFADKLRYWLINEPGFKIYICRMSIYYKNTPDGKKLLFDLMLMIVSIGTHMNPMENGL